MINKIPYPLLLVSALTMAYINSLHGAFQFDDYNVIVNNSLVHSWSAWLTDLPHGIRPFLKLTYTLNWTMGWGTFGFHLFNHFSIRRARGCFPDSSPLCRAPGADGGRYLYLRTFHIAHGFFLSGRFLRLSVRG
jgi:hypothetical protein